jgi:chromate reductase
MLKLFNSKDSAMPNLHVVGISGSLRKGSYNTALLHAAQVLLPSDVSYAEVAIGNLPFYNADEDGEHRPEVVTQFRNALAKADAFIIASPEYNYSIPGVLKNAIDWASRGKDSPLLGKAVALMGATNGMWGTARMQQSIRPIFQSLNMFPVNKPEVYVAQAQSKFDEAGNLIDDKTKEMIRKQLQGLKNLALRLKD